MKRTTKTARVALAITLAEGRAPTEFRLFTAELVSTSKGDFVFDDKAAKAVMSAWEAQGNELPIDYDHAMVDPTTRPQDRGAAGWFKLALKGGELWAVDIRWTADGEKAVASGGWRFTSPCFGYDAGSKRITGLVNVAITNLPATKHMDPLMAMSDSRVNLSVSLREQGEAVSAAIKQARALAMIEHPADFCIEELFDDAVVYATWEGGGRTWRVGYELDGTDVKLVGEPVEVTEKREWAPVAPATTDMTASARPETTAGKDPRKEQRRMKTVLAALGLKVDAEEHEAVVALSRIKDDAEAVRTELCSLTASKTVAEATGKVLAWKTSHEKVETLSKRNAELEAERVERDIVAKVDKRIADGDLIPAKRDEVIKLGRAHGAEALDAFLGCLPKGGGVDTTGGADKGTVQTVQLSAQQKKLARDAGLTDEEFLKAEVL